MNQLGGDGGLLSSFGTFDKKYQSLSPPSFSAFPSPSFSALNPPTLTDLFGKQSALQLQTADKVSEEELPLLAKMVREIDGSNNNRKNANFGKALSTMPRLTEAAYSDGKAKMIWRKNPRGLSNTIGSVAQGEEIKLNEYGLNMLFVLFGQFVDHDLDLVSSSGT